MQGVLSPVSRRCLLDGARHLWRRRISLKAGGYPQDFVFFPDFLSVQEQRVLLSTSLQKLDKTENRYHRLRRKEYMANNVISNSAASVAQDLFLPDEYYHFEEGHYDGVIRRFREMHVTAWPDNNPELARVLGRLQNLHPTQETQTHILHLASDGEIFPHIDNLEASGSWILGASLGNTRVLCLENVHDSTDTHEILLSSGSVYIQRDSVRYDYKHSILRERNFEDAMYGSGQRLSIMIRDRKLAS